MGRWSRIAASAFVRILPVSPRARWLDFGCGTGALTQAILDCAAPTSVVACDPSANFVAFARAQNADPRVAFVVADADTLAEPDQPFDVVAASLVLNFLANPAAALRQLLPMTRLGGVLAASVWDYAGEMQFLRVFWDAARDLDPGAAPLDEGQRFSLCTPARLATLFRNAGLTAVRTEAVVIDTPFSDFADYWAPFLSGVGPAGTYVATLAEPARAALASALASRLPSGPAGTIPLRARCWVAWGHRPVVGVAYS